MKIIKSLPVFVLAGLLGGALSVPYVQAQETTSGREMHETGSSAKGVMSDTGQTLKHAYRASKAEMSDAALTTKVKSALMANRETRELSIHVKSNRGIVTLSGNVESPATASRAERVAANVKGVRSVNNDLTWHTSANSDMNARR